MKICGIYKIVSPTNRVYIGQSIDVDKRIMDYKRMNCKTQKKLYNSLFKHGVEKHMFELIEECEIDKLNERERYWQDFYDVLNGGLNCLLTSTNSKKLVHSDEIRQKMRESQLGRKQSKETIEKRMTHLRGKPLKQEHRNKISESNKNKKFSETP